MPVIHRTGGARSALWLCTFLTVASCSGNPADRTLNDAASDGPSDSPAAELDLEGEGPTDVTNDPDGPPADPVVDGADAASDSDADEPAVGGSGTLVGAVLAPNGAGFDIVAGAVLSVRGGPETLTNHLGQFELIDVDAGVDLVIDIAGPQSGDPDNPAVYSTNQVALRITTDEVRTIIGYLLPGCVGFVDGLSGGVVELEDCGGAGSAELEFGDAFETDGGDPFEGLVRVESAVVAGDDVNTLAALPIDGEPFSSIVLGAAEVRLLDAQTGQRVQLAEGETATLRYELGELPEGLSDDDRIVQLYDADSHTWTDQPSGVVAVEGERRWQELTVDHFSTRVTRMADGSGSAACVSANPTYEGVSLLEAGWGVLVDVQTSRGRSQQLLTLRTDPLNIENVDYPPALPVDCLLVVPESAVQMTFNLFLGNRRQGIDGPMLSATRGLTSSGTGNLVAFRCCRAGDQPPDECGCIEQGDVPLGGPGSGCITGTVQLSDLPADGRRVTVKKDGYSVAELTLGADGTFCTDLPYDSETELTFWVDGAGSISATPAISGLGNMCGGPGCSDLGPLSPGCGSSLCLEADFATEVTLFDDCVGNCGSCAAEDDLWSIQLDPSDSTPQSDIAHYLWRLEDSSGNPVGTPIATRTPDIVGFCVAEGDYRARLTVQRDPSTIVGQPPQNGVAIAERAVSVSPRLPGPCSGEVTSNTTTLTIEATVSYAYDDADRLERIELQQTGTFPLSWVETYDVATGLLATYSSNGGVFTETYSYESVPEITGVTSDNLMVSQADGTGSTTQFVDYRYAVTADDTVTCTVTTCRASARDRCQGETPDVLPIITSQDLVFNEHGQLTSAAGATYTYLTEAPILEHQMACARALTQPRPIAYPLGERALGLTTQRFAYDAFGNLETLTIDGGASGSVVWTYEHSCW